MQIASCGSRSLDLIAIKNLGGVNLANLRSFAKVSPSLKFHSIL